MPGYPMVEEMTLRIGIDFDNTIVDYRPVFLPAARALGLVDASFAAHDKTEIRDHLRAQPGGEERWQQLQAHVYGVAIDAAPAYAGVERFIGEARRRGAALAIVSHRSRFAAAAPGGPDLREAARRWLEAHGLADAGSIAPEHAFFEETRGEKLERVRSLGLTHFIDDLADVLADPAFPAETRGVHFRESWEDVFDDIFG
jgi:hypothetical protein